MFREAYNLVELGWTLGLNHWVTPRGACSCGSACHQEGKHPLCIPPLPGWLPAPIKTVEGLDEAFSCFPRANVTILTGRDYGVLGLDLDQQDGARFLALYQEKYGALPTTPRVKSPRGEHYYFRYPDEPWDIRIVTDITSSPLLPGAFSFDIFGNEGRITAPPSITRYGSYQWMLHPKSFRLAPVPPPLLEMLLADTVGNYW